MKKRIISEIVGFVTIGINAYLFIHSSYLLYCYNFTNKLFLFRYPNWALIITLLGSLGIIISILAYKETIRIKLLLVMILLIGSLVASHLVCCHQIRKQQPLLQPVMQDSLSSYLESIRSITEEPVPTFLYLYEIDGQVYLDLITRRAPSNSWPLKDFSVQYYGLTTIDSMFVWVAANPTLDSLFTPRFAKVTNDQARRYYTWVEQKKSQWIENYPISGREYLIEDKQTIKLVRHYQTR